VTGDLAWREPPDVTIVTGATGWLGTALLHALAVDEGTWRRPGRLRALVTTAQHADRLRALAPTIDPVVGDVTADLDPLFAIGPGDPVVDVVHAAGVIHPSRTDEFEAVNAAGTAAVVDAARRHGVRRLVHVSSNSPFGTNSYAGDRFRQHEPYHPYLGYGRSKMHAELAVLDAVERGLDAVIVRPPWFYGPHQPPRQTTFFRMVRTGRFPVFGRGDQVRSMVYVGHLVDAIVRAELVVTEPGLGWWAADANPYTVGEIVETVGLALRAEGFEVSPNRLRIPDIVGRVAETADRAVQLSGRYQQQLHVLGEMNKHIACDIAATRRDLGYAPWVNLFEGMRRSIRWCRSEGLEL